MNYHAWNTPSCQTIYWTPATIASSTSSVDDPM
ncbi:unnamed protein product [Acanthoscelides obtectus]|uniref:Uncharacterized protein n=1 Tax=Acanthoscelides obtectus TaxID=200917 RepID=A0A9P0QCI7_ACAOB|nr:unnamed protein product [Acanthoscelides obtectus]CAK1689255.1 hypothetical protein AOBTE_LOCUS37121 [Acanthoscelides obtectus]